MAYQVGIIGATGAVGEELIRLLVERNFPMDRLRVFASSRSAGKRITVAGNEWEVEETRPEVFEDLDIALFSAGAATSRELAPEAIRRDCLVVDNSSAFRMDPEVPLIVPEINASAIPEHRGIIANPNCSTAIALMGLYPLHQTFGLRRFIACTYQAVSGSGVAGMRELENQVRSWNVGENCPPETYPHPIAFNLFPHVDNFLEDGYTKEEHKMANESRKILGLGDLGVSTTCVRVPVFRTHCIAIHAEFEEQVSVNAARSAVANFSGAELLDDPQSNAYPTPLQFSGRENCGIGRLRKDAVFGNGLAFFVAGDQLLKGAALNAVQIAEAWVQKYA